MPRLKAANNAKTTLTVAIDAIQTEFQVDDASKFPAPPFRITVDEEIMEVGAVDQPTRIFSSVLRAQEGTIAASHGAGASVDNRITAGTYDELVGIPELNDHETAAVLPHADGSVTDAKIGTRTPDDTKAAAAGAQTLTDVLSMLANRVKALGGLQHWYDALTTDLASLAASIPQTTIYPKEAQSASNAVYCSAGDYIFVLENGGALSKFNIDTGAKTVCATSGITSGNPAIIPTGPDTLLAFYYNSGKVGVKKYTISTNTWSANLGTSTAIGSFNGIAAAYDDISGLVYILTCDTSQYTTNRLTFNPTNNTFGAPTAGTASYSSYYSQFGYWNSGSIMAVVGNKLVYFVGTRLAELPTEGAFDSRNNSVGDWDALLGYQVTVQSNTTFRRGFTAVAAHGGVAYACGTYEQDAGGNSQWMFSNVIVRVAGDGTISTGPGGGPQTGDIPIAVYNRDRREWLTLTRPHDTGVVVGTKVS